MLTLQTPRLLLRPFHESDLDAYAEMLADPEVVRFVGSGETVDRTNAWRSLAFHLGHWQLRGFGKFAVERKDSGELIGRVGLFYPFNWPEIEIGWMIARPHWGAGLAVEAAQAAARWAFDTLELPYLASFIQPENTRSIRVAEKLGETLQRRDQLRGQDVLVYGFDADTFRNHNP
jgi:RimJ/RimL family protein N-acetyltransferase